jgi:hypothetical protein
MIKKAQAQSWIIHFNRLALTLRRGVLKATLPKM